MDIVFSDATHLAEAIRTGDISASEALEAHLAQIEKHNAVLNAVVTLDAEAARKRALDAEGRWHSRHSFEIGGRCADGENQCAYAAGRRSANRESYFWAHE